MRKVRNFKQNFSIISSLLIAMVVLASVPSLVRNLEKTQNFWANFTDFEPEINIIKCKTKKLKQKT